MNSCKRNDCFACVYGKCLALWDTSGQEKCRFYRTDLNIQCINKELSLRSKRIKEGCLNDLTKAV